MIVSVNNLLRRVAKLEAQTKSKFIAFKMADGSSQKLPHKDYLKVCGDAVYGITSPQVAIVTEAISCNKTGRILELVQMCIE